MTDAEKLAYQAAVRAELTKLILAQDAQYASRGANMPYGNVIDQRNQSISDEEAKRLIATYGHGYRTPGGASHAGTYSAGADLPYFPADTRLSRTLGSQQIANPQGPPSYEVWVPPGQTSVQVPQEKLRDLYGPGAITIKGRQLPPEPKDEDRLRGLY